LYWNYNLKDGFYLFILLQIILKLFTNLKKKNRKTKKRQECFLEILPMCLAHGLILCFSYTKHIRQKAKEQYMVFCCPWQKMETATSSGSSQACAGRSHSEKTLRRVRPRVGSALV
jgi:hypothetical protein